MLVHNSSKSPVVVFAYSFTDLLYGAFKDSRELQPGASAVLKASSDGAGKITVGLTIGVAKPCSEAFVEWADVMASAACADHRCLAVLSLSLPPPSFRSLSLCPPPTPGHPNF